MATENPGMEIQGRVHNGDVVLDGERSLPEGTLVTVLCPTPPTTGPSGSGQRVSLPLVPSDGPVSRWLTAERVAGLPGRRRCFWLTPIRGWRCPI
jgi:hypothetical protein